MKPTYGTVSQLFDPFRADRIKHGAYELSIGPEAYIPSDGKKSKVEPESPVTIPPGQFGLLITREVVTVPKNAIAFISIRARTKFRGLVNVSGFHVDPGYSDRLMFSVYNAGSSPIILEYDQPVFLIWYADLDGVETDPYPPREGELKGISAEDMMKLQGEVASPAELKKQLDRLKDDFDTRLQRLVTESDKKNHEVKMEADKRVHAIEVRMGVVQGLLGACLLAAIGAFFRPSVIGAPDKQTASPSVRVETQAAPPDIPKAKE